MEQWCVHGNNTSTHLLLDTPRDASFLHPCSTRKPPQHCPIPPWENENIQYPENLLELFHFGKYLKSSKSLTETKTRTQSSHFNCFLPISFHRNNVCILQEQSHKTFPMYPTQQLTDLVRERGKKHLFTLSDLFDFYIKICSSIPSL